MPDRLLQYFRHTHPLLGKRQERLSLLPQEVKKHICFNPIRVSPKPLRSDSPESRRGNFCA